MSHEEIHILIKVKCEGYNSRYYTTFIDTGARTNMCRRKVLPEEYWKELKNPIIIAGFNQEGNLVRHKAINITIQIWDKELVLNELYPCDEIFHDIILGYKKFLKNYEPLQLQEIIYY